MTWSLIMTEHIGFACLLIVFLYSKIKSKLYQDKGKRLYDKWKIVIRCTMLFPSIYTIIPAIIIIVLVYKWDRGLKSLRWHNKPMTDWELEPRFTFLSKLNLFRAFFQWRNLNLFPLQRLKKITLNCSFYFQDVFGGQIQLAEVSRKRKVMCFIASNELLQFRSFITFWQLSC